MIAITMGLPYESPITEEPEWEPEPLSIPVAIPLAVPLDDTKPTQEGQRDEREGESDKPGSYVIVIDLA